MTKPDKKPCQWRRMLRLLAGFLLLVVAITLYGGFRLYDLDTDWQELGIPHADTYTADQPTRCVWELQLQDGLLFAGGGDYDRNAGPVPVPCLNLSDTAAGWHSTGTLPEEQIDRLLTVGGELVTPGIDPRGSDCAYYRWDGSAWQTVTGIPDGLHVFDLIDWENKLFAGIATSPTGSPIVCSVDGSAFHYVPLLKDGQPVDLSDGVQIRTHDFFVLDGQLYASLFMSYQSDNGKISYEVFRYEEGVFHLHANHKGQLQLPAPRTSYRLVTGKAAVGSTLYFTTGYLYETDDLATITLLPLPGNPQVFDVLEEDGRLYVLAAAKAEDGWQIGIWQKDAGKGFRQVARLDYPVPPLCMTYDEDSFYIGMGDKNTPHEKNGMVLRVERGLTW